MNTPAIASPTPAPTTLPHKAPPVEQSGTNSPFGQVLSKEMADRNSSANNASTPAPAEQSQADKAADTPADTVKAQVSEDGKMENAVAATEQMLMMAMQLAPQPAVPNASSNPQVLSDSDHLASQTPATALAQLLDPGLNNLNPENTVSHAGASRQPGNTSAHAGERFDATLKQIAEQGISAETGNSSSKTALTTDADGAGTIEVVSGRTMSAGTATDAIDKSHDAVADRLSEALAPLQQAATAAAQAPQTRTADRIAPHVGTPAWNQAIGQKVVWMIGAEQQSASLTLNPPDLGPLQVVLSVSNTQASASFYASQPEVRQAIESALPRLREMLGDAGIQLGQANVSAGSPQQQDTHGGVPPSSRPHQTPNDETRSAPHQVISATRIVRDGLIDTFA